MEIYLIYETLYYNSRKVIIISEPTGLIYALTVFTVTLLLSILLQMVITKLTNVKG